MKNHCSVCYKILIDFAYFEVPERHGAWRHFQLQRSNGETTRTYMAKKSSQKYFSACSALARSMLYTGGFA